MKKIKAEPQIVPLGASTVSYACSPLPFFAALWWWLHSALPVNLHRRVVFWKMFLLCFCFGFFCQLQLRIRLRSTALPLVFFVCFAVFSNFARFFNLHAGLCILFRYICCCCCCSCVYERSTF